MNRRTAVALIAVLSGAPALLAQAAPDTLAIHAYQDSLRVLDPEGIRAVVTGLADPRAPDERLRAGWTLLIAGERLDSTPLVVRAMDQFYEVTVRRSRWPEGYFGLGEAKRRLAGVGIREIRSPHQPPGTGWIWGAARAYLEALQRDPRHAEAARSLARLGPLLDTRSRAKAAWEAVSIALARDSSDAELWMLAAAAAERTGRYADGLVALDRAAHQANASPGRISFEAAALHYALGRPEAAESSYYAAAASPDTSVVSLLRGNLAYIADSTELRTWDTLAVAERVGWLREFWGRREREAGRPAGSRLREHMRRLAYAREHFAVLPTWAREYTFETISHEEIGDIDDRGAIYVRHGEPDVTTGLIGTGGDLPLNASWMYYRPEGNLIFHFMAVRGRWALIPSLLAISDTSPELFASRMALDPWYGLIGLRMERDSIMSATNRKLGRQVYDPETGRSEIERLTERDRRARTADIRRGLSTDSDPLRFERELEPIVQVFGAGTADLDRGRLVVALSLPATDRMVAESLPGGAVGYSFRLRVTSADDAGRTTLDQDSVVKFRLPRALRRGENISMVRSFDLPATGDQRVRVILTDTARSFGAVRVVNGVPLPPRSVDSVVVTDLIVGSTRSGVSWHRPEGSAVPLHPLNAWAQDDALEIAFEVDGLRAGDRYRVRLSIADIGADSTAPPRASVEFENQASGGREFITQSLGLRTIRPGRYLLTATVQSGDQVIRRERRITVVRAR
jgi:GWxTD domain-containing protein